MNNFHKLADILAERLRDANEILAYLNEKNIIDEDEPILKNWEILADARNEIDDPESKKLSYDELNEIFESHSRFGIGGTNCRLMSFNMFVEVYSEILRGMENE